ncbi:MAG: membrane protein [Thermosynechococcus sp.]|uniref:divergent PAP2 family protein n=1 Tax=Thermosynechococcus sp. TaxID=2814275 RepID=UPI0021FD393E|nr:MAG: membrane protein [Thermosynechococcus sp.]
MMDGLRELLANRVLWVAFAASAIAQMLKLLIDIAKHRKLNFRVLVETGGMPSSHSALVTALATGVGLQRGWDSIEFAIAIVFACIVMYDAAGVRQAAGKQARILNQIVDEFFQEGHELAEARLKELLGHTPIQVIVGSALGVAIAWLGV